MSLRESRHVRVGGLPEGATDERIIAHFSPYGNVTKISRPADGSGDVVVSYSAISSAKKAIDTLNERASPARGKFDGLTLRIAFSDSSSIPSTPTSAAGSLLFHAPDSGRASARSSSSSEQPLSSHLATPLAFTSQPSNVAPAGVAGSGTSAVQVDIGGPSKAVSKLAAATKRVLGSGTVVVADPLHKNASRTLYVGNLPSGVADEQLRAIFIPYGHILDYDVKSRHGASPTAFIEFSDIRAVAQILRAAVGNNRLTIGNKRLELNWGSSVRTTKLWIGALPSTCSQQYLLSKLRVIERAEEVTELIYDERHCEALALYKTTDASQLAYKRIKSRGLTFPSEASDEDQCCEVDFCSEKLHDFFVDRQFGRVPKAGRSRINATAAPPDPPLGAVSDVSSRRESSIDEPTPSTTNAAMVPPDPIITARPSTSNQPPKERARTGSASRPTSVGGSAHRPRVSTPSDRQVDDAGRRGGGGRKVILPPSPADVTSGKAPNRGAERVPVDRHGSSHREYERRSGSRGRSSATPRRDYSDWERQPSSSVAGGRGGRDEKSKSVSSSDRHPSSGASGRRRADLAARESSSATTCNKKVPESSSSSSTTSSSSTGSSRSTSSDSSTNGAERERNKLPTFPSSTASAARKPSSSKPGAYHRRERSGPTSPSSHSRSEKREPKEHSPPSASGTLLCPPPPAPIIGGKTPRSRQHSGSSSASSMFERSSAARKGIEEKLAAIEKLREVRKRKESEPRKGHQRDHQLEQRKLLASRSSDVHHLKPAEKQPAHAASSHPASGQATSSRTPVKAVPTSPLYRHMSDPRLRKSGGDSFSCAELCADLSVPRFGKAFLAKYGRTASSVVPPPFSDDQSNEWNTFSFEEPHDTTHEQAAAAAAAPCSSRMMSVTSLHCEESVIGAADGLGASQEWTAPAKKEGVLLSRGSSTDSMLDTPPPVVTVAQFDISAFRLSCFVGRGDILAAWRERLSAMRARLDEAEKDRERILNYEPSHQRHLGDDYEAAVSSASVQEELERFRTTKELCEMATVSSTHHYFDFATPRTEQASGWSAPPALPGGVFFRTDMPASSGKRETMPASADAAKASLSPFGFGLFDTNADHTSRESSSIPPSPHYTPTSKSTERSYVALASQKSAAMPHHPTSHRNSIESPSASTPMGSSSGKLAPPTMKSGVADPRRKSTHSSLAPTNIASPTLKHPTPTASSSTIRPSSISKEASRHGKQLDDLFHKQASSWSTSPLSAGVSIKQERRLVTSSSADTTKPSFAKTPSGPSSHHPSYQRQSSASGSKTSDRSLHKTQKHHSASMDARSKDHEKRKEKERHVGDKLESDPAKEEKMRRRKKKRFTNSSDDSEADTDDEEAVFGLGGIDMEEQRRIMEQITSGKCGTTMYDRVKQRSSALRPDQKRKKEQALKKIAKMREKSGLKKVHDKKFQRVQLSSSSSDESEETSRTSAGRHHETAAEEVSDDNASLASHSTVQSRSDAPIPKVSAKATCIVGDVKVEMAPVAVEAVVAAGKGTTRSADTSIPRTTSSKKEVEKKIARKANKNEAIEAGSMITSNAMIVDDESSPTEMSSSGRSGSESEGEACVRKLRGKLLKYHQSSEEEAEGRFEAAMESIFPEGTLNTDGSSSAHSPSSTSHTPILKKEAGDLQDAAAIEQREDCATSKWEQESRAAEHTPVKKAKFDDDASAAASESREEHAGVAVHESPRPTVESTSAEDVKRKDGPRRGRPPKMGARKRSVDETETKRQEEKRIVEILHSLCPKTSSPSVVEDSATNTLIAAAAVTTTNTPVTTASHESPSVAMNQGTSVDSVEMDDFLGIAFASADVCSGFEVVDQGRIGAESAVKTTSTTITSPTTSVPASGRPPPIKRGRGRPPKNRAPLEKDQSKCGSFEEPAAQFAVMSQEELKRRAEIVRKMREEEEAAAAMSLTHEAVQESSTNKEAETDAHGVAVPELADMKSPKCVEPHSRGSYVEVDAEDLLQQRQSDQQKKRVDETEKELEEAKSGVKAVVNTTHLGTPQEDKERRKLEEEHEDRLTATVNAVIASSKIAAAESTTSHDLLRSRCATVRPLTVAAAATPQAAKVPLASPTAPSAQPDVKRSLPQQPSPQLQSPTHAGSTRAGMAIVGHSQGTPVIAGTQVPPPPSNQSLPSSAHKAFPKPTYGITTPGVGAELTRHDSNIRPPPANTSAGMASAPTSALQAPAAVTLPPEIPLALYGHLLGNPPPSYSQLLSPNHQQQQATFLVNQLIASQRWNPAAVASMQPAGIVPSVASHLGSSSANSIPIDMLQHIRAEFERQQQADAGGAHMSRPPSTSHHQPPPFGLAQQPRQLQSPSISEHPAESQPLSDADSNVAEQIQSQYPVLWQGQLTLKHAHTFVEMHKICGNGDFVYAMQEELMSSINGYKTIKITQKMRLSEDQLERIIMRMSNDEDYVGLCCIPCGRDGDEIGRQSDSMRHSFIEFLMEKQAAGIVNQGPDGTPASCVVHVFPPVKFVYEIMMQHAPDLLVRVEESQTSYLFVIIFANQ